MCVSYVEGWCMYVCVLPRELCFLTRRLYAHVCYTYMCVCMYVSNMVYTHNYYHFPGKMPICHMHRPPLLSRIRTYLPQGRVSYQEGRGMYVWHSRIEIRYYSVTYFECITKFNNCSTELEQCSYALHEHLRYSCIHAV